MTLRRSDAIAMAVLVVLLAAITILFGERTDLNHGYGWDGASYAMWAFDFPHKVLTDGVTAYQAQRVLPSLVVYLTDPYNPLRGFALLDTVCLVTSAVLYGRIATRLGWSRSAAWAGFAGVFGSFAIARHALYYPNLTDPSAFLLGMAMTWAYVADLPIVLVAVALLGAFTWPALPPIALALLLFPRAPLAGDTPRATAALAAAVATIAGLVAIAYFAMSWLPVAAGLHRELAWWLTFPLLGVAIAAGSYALAKNLGGWTRVPRRWWAIAVAVVVYALRFAWIARVGTAGPGPGTTQFATEQALGAMRGPVWGPVHHVAYFGPIIAVAILHWRRLGRDLGLGAVLGLAMVLAFGMAAESRQWTHLFPLLAVATIHATRWTPRRALVFAALALIWSKLWWMMSTGHPGASIEWPALRYFMQLGPWASNETYAWHLVAAAITTLILWRTTSEA